MLSNPTVILHLVFKGLFRIKPNREGWNDAECEQTNRFVCRGDCGQVQVLEDLDKEFSPAIFGVVIAVFLAGLGAAGFVHQQKMRRLGEIDRLENKAKEVEKRIL